MNTHTKAADPSQRANRTNGRSANALSGFSAAAKRRRDVAQNGRNKKATFRLRGWLGPLDEGAHRIGIGRTSVYKLAAEGKLRLIKVAGRTLIPDSEIVRIAAEGA